MNNKHQITQMNDNEKICKCMRLIHLTILILLHYTTMKH